MANVLIVDDSVSMAEMLALLVETYGHKAFTAHAGSSALAMVESHSPDVVLLDLMMPDMDGFEVMQRLQASSANLHLPVIVITARADEDLEQRVAEAGAAGMLRKPLEAHALIEQIARLTAARSDDREERRAGAPGPN